MSNFSTDEIDLDQLCVERLVKSLRGTIIELQSLRLDPATSQYVGAEEANLSSALTGLQALVSHIAIRRPMLRIVK